MKSWWQWHQIEALVAATVAKVLAFIIAHSSVVMRSPYHYTMMLVTVYMRIGQACVLR